MYILITVIWLINRRAESILSATTFVYVARGLESKTQPIYSWAFPTLQLYDPRNYTMLSVTVLCIVLVTVLLMSTNVAWNNLDPEIMMNIVSITLRINESINLNIEVQPITNTMYPRPV